MECVVPIQRAASIVLQSQRQKSTNLVLLKISKAPSNSLNIMMKPSPTLKPTVSASSFSYRVYGSGEWLTLHITCRRDCASDKIYSQYQCSKKNTSDHGAGAIATAYFILYIGVIIVNIICMHRNTYLSFLDMPRKP